MDARARDLGRGRTRFRRIARVVLRAGLVLVLVILALPPLALLALRFQAPRTLVARELDGALSGLFRGRLHFDRIERVDLGGARLSGRIDDASGKRVVRFQGADVRLSVIRLLVRLVRDGGSPSLIHLDRVSIDDVELALIDDGSGGPSIAHAFDPRTPSPTPSSGPSPTVELPVITLGHAWVHGQLGTGPLIDLELKDMASSLGVDPTLFHVEMKRAELVSRLSPMALDPKGRLEGALRIPLGAGAMSARGSLSGQVAGTPLEARGSLDGNQVDARATLPAIEQPTVARFAPNLALRGKLKVVATATGTTDSLAYDLNAAGEFGELEARGTLVSTPELRVSSTVTGRRLDASALVPGAPATVVDLDAQLALRSAASKLAVDGDLRARESGVNAQAKVALRLAGERGTVEGDVQATLSDPRRLVSLTGIHTEGSINAHGELGWPAQKAYVTVDARLARLTQDKVAAGPTQAHVLLTGPLAAAHVEGSVVSRDVRAVGREFPQVRVGVNGTFEQARVDVALASKAGERLKVRSDLRLQGGGVELTGTEAVLHDKQGTLELSVPRASIAGPRIEVTRAKLEGAGALQASVSVRGSTVRVTATSERLDVVRLAALAGVATPLHSMKATLDLDATYGAAVSGRVVGEVVDITYDSVKNGRASFDLGLRDNALTGRIATELAPGARLTLEAERLKIFRLVAPRADLPEGKLKLSGKVDLTCMGPLITASRSVPINEARGSLDLDVEYERAALAEVPTLRGRVRTHDLALVGKRPESNAIDSSGEAIAAAPSVYRGVDFGIDLALDAPSGRLTTHVGFYDSQSELMQIDASAGPLPRGSLGTILAALADVPLEIDAHVPARRLRTLPPPIRPLSLRGTVGGDLHFKGTVHEPELVVDARASRLTVASERIQGEPKPSIGALAHLEVKRMGGALKVVADSVQTRAAEVTLDWAGDVVAAAREPARFADFTAKARVILDQLELENIPALKNRQIEGRLSGTAAIEYGPDRRLVSADIAAHPLRLGQSTLEHLNVSVRAEPTGLQAAISSRGQGGSLDVSVTSGLHWPKRGVPELAGDIVASLGARGFRLGALWPLVSGSVNELDGKLDADLRARVQGDRVELSGKGRLTEGVVQIPALGQRFESIGARISVAPAAIVIDDLDARGLTGGFKGNGRIELDEHLGLRELDAALEIQKKHKLPVTLQGVSMGDAWGKLEAKLVKRPDRMDVTVRVPDLHIDVPDTAGGGVQDLGPADNVRIGVRRADAVFTALPVQPLEKPAENPTPLDVNIELGSIWLKKGDLVTAQLSGNLHAAVADKSVLTGRIDLKAGDLDVQGKRFEIERGTVTFTGGDPANPTISAEARWDAPAGYSVYASYAGTAQKGKLTLRAEPPLTQDEIVNLILFGTPEGSVASGGGDTAASAVGLAGGTAVKGINRAISDFTHLDIQARIDTSTGSARPELMIPITPKLSARVTRAIGEPTPGTSPDRTFLTLELRLKRNWALSALLGDRGASALDLIWRKHY